MCRAEEFALESSGLVCSCVERKCCSCVERNSCSCVERKGLLVCRV